MGIVVIIGFDFMVFCGNVMCLRVVWVVVSFIFF